MGIFDKFKKSKNESIFSFDESENRFVAELSGITFICEEVQEQYEQKAKALAENYAEKLTDIAEYLYQDIVDMFGVSDLETIKNSLGKPRIDLDNGRLTYLEQTLDDIHIIDVEFDGIFETFFCSGIDG